MDKIRKKDICKYFNVCPIRRFYKEGKLKRKWLEEYCFKGGKGCRRYALEQKGVAHPDNMLPNGEIDKNLK